MFRNIGDKRHRYGDHWSRDGNSGWHFRRCSRSASNFLIAALVLRLRVNKIKDPHSHSAILLMSTYLRRINACVYVLLPTSDVDILSCMPHYPFLIRTVHDQFDRRTGWSYYV